MPYQINTLTNHILEKQLSAYGSEAEWEVSTAFIRLWILTKYIIEDMQCGSWTQER